MRLGRKRKKERMFQPEKMPSAKARDGRDQVILENLHGRSTGFGGNGGDSDIRAGLENLGYCRSRLLYR